MLYVDTYANAASPATVLKGDTNFSKDVAAATSTSGDNTDILVESSGNELEEYMRNN